MDTKQNMIIDRQLNKIITPDIIMCSYSRETRRYTIKFNNGKSYSYSYNRISWLKDPKALDPTLYHITHSGKGLYGICAIYVFSDRVINYWHICFENGKEQDYSESDLNITKSCLDNAVAVNVFQYLKQTARLVSLKAEDGTKLLSKQYEKISAFVGEDTALAAYLHPDSYKNPPFCSSTPIFPFGCNSSQFKAVKAALENKISVIQGPLGTGKTQTILNIIANLLIEGKTVQVVSNNNSATANILEKLASPKYGMDFLVAPLGKSENKTYFIDSQTGYYPDLTDWCIKVTDKSKFFEDIRKSSQELNYIFQIQEHLSLVKQELRELKTEFKHFQQYSEETNPNLSPYKFRKKATADKSLQLWQECQDFSDRNKKILYYSKSKVM